MVNQSLRFRYIKKTFVNTSIFISIRRLLKYAIAKHKFDVLDDAEFLSIFYVATRCILMGQEFLHIQYVLEPTRANNSYQYI